MKLLMSDYEVTLVNDNMQVSKSIHLGMNSELRRPGSRADKGGPWAGGE